MSIKNTQELRDLLLDSIDKVKKGEMEPKEAGAIVGLSAQVISSCHLDMAYAKVKIALGNKEMNSLQLSGPKK
jgi:hypothetical protein